MSEPKKKGNGHAVALWAGLTAFLVNLAAVNIVTLLGDDTAVVYKGIAVLITSVFIGGSVYARERLNDAREEKKRKEIDSGKET